MTQKGSVKRGRPGRPVIGTCIKTGCKIRLVGATEIAAAGFEQAAVWRCLSGKIKQHAGFTWQYEDGKPTVPAGPRRRNRNARAVIGINVETGQMIRLVGGSEIVRAGFNQSCVVKAIAGTFSQHRGYTWEYEETFHARQDHNLKADAKIIRKVG